MKKKQRKVRLIRAAIQLIFFIAAPSLFSTAFAGVKSIFLAIGGQQSVTWNSFLDITALLLIITILFGRHFCGYACAFGSLGDALYELTAFIRAKCFGKKKKHGYPEEWVHRLQKVKYVLLAFLLLSCMTGFYSKLQGMSPWDVFSMITTGRLPKSTYIVGTVLLILIMVGMCTQERFFHAYSRKASKQYISGGNHPFASDHGGNVYTGTLFLPVSLPHGSSICNHADHPGSTFQTESSKLCAKVHSL